jgi:hypothetical protein
MQLVVHYNVSSPALLIVQADNQESQEAIFRRHNSSGVISIEMIEASSPAVIRAT